MHEADKKVLSAKADQKSNPSKEYPNIFVEAFFDLAWSFDGKGGFMAFILMIGFTGWAALGIEIFIDEDFDLVTSIGDGLQFLLGWFGKAIYQICLTAGVFCMILYVPMYIFNVCVIFYKRS